MTSQPTATVPEVSVIVPSYNTAKFIAEAVESALKQTFQDIEVIVVNDGSPDTKALEAAIEPFRERIIYIRQENTGLSGARNTGIRAARGNFVLNLDSDDTLVPHCVETQVRLMREHPEYDAAYCNSFNTADTPEAAALWGPLNNVKHMDVYPSEGPVSFCSIMESRTCPRDPGSIYRRAMLSRVNFYDETLRNEMDLDMWLKILKATPPGRIGYTHETLVNYRLRADSLTMHAGHSRAVLTVLEKVARTLDLTPEERKCLERRTAECRFAVELTDGKKALLEGRSKEAAVNYEYCYQHTRKLKYLATIVALRACPWALAPALKILGRA